MLALMPTLVHGHWCGDDVGIRTHPSHMRSSRAHVHAHTHTHSPTHVHTRARARTHTQGSCGMVTGAQRLALITTRSPATAPGCFTATKSFATSQKRVFVLGVGCQRGNLGTSAWQQQKSTTGTAYSAMPQSASVCTGGAKKSLPPNRIQCRALINAW
jgi:hypothetical protein